MGLGFSLSLSSPLIVFSFLFVLMSAEARKERHSLQNHGEAMAAHTHEMDMISMHIFFTISDLKSGKIIPVFFSKRDPATSPHLLAREEAESIPFSLPQLPHLLQFFGFSPDSRQAAAMADTLRHCETEPIEGETKSCVTSLESMLDFARGIFGPETGLKVMSTAIGEKTSGGLGNYTVLRPPKPVPAPKMVACHTLPYPYAVFYCHSQEGESRVFEVSLGGGEDGERVEAVAVCHMDTSKWNRDHVSFRFLGIQPGSSPVCHFFPPDNLIWVPNSPGLIL